jgi:hypothetical protein
MGLRGIVLKKANMPNRPRSKCGWIRVKAPGWRERNREQW